MIHWLKKIIMGPPAEETALEVEIIRQTEKAILINHAGQQVWLPKSKIRIEPLNGQLFKVSIPSWLFERKFPA
jgi:hypothetical protein